MSPSNPHDRAARPGLPPILLTYLLLWGGLMAMAAPAEGQLPTLTDPVPSEVREQILEILNNPATLRITGSGRIPEGTRIDGDVGVIGGTLVLGGQVSGRIVIVNGNLEVVSPDARVGGEVLVTGGRISGPGAPGVEARARSWSAPLRIQIRGDEVELRASPGPERPDFLTWDLGPATLRPTLRSDGPYNRVEGLPVRFGGLVEAGSRNPTVVEAFGVWRSVSGLEIDTENLGYRFGLVQELGGRGEARLRLSQYSVVRPLEDRGLGDTEVGLATFFLHRDFRDHFHREGWEVRSEVTPTGLPLQIEVAYTEEEHEFAPIRDPWTLRGSDALWRLQPQVAEGTVRHLSASGDLDLRDDPTDPSDGWWVRGMIRRTVGGTLEIPDFVGVPGDVTGLQSPGALPLTTDGELDIRRYNRLSPTTRLNLRVLLAGSVNGNPLPPQFQRTLGGEGSLPGHRRFAQDCGARSASVFDPASEDEEMVWPAYGCDRVALGQIELRGGLPVPAVGGGSAGGGDDWELRALLDLRPEWTVFANVGRGWSLADPTDPGMVPLGSPIRSDSPVRGDVGVGLHAGPLGLYWAYPLNRRDRGLNFFVRLQKRF